MFQLFAKASLRSDFCRPLSIGPGALVLTLATLGQVSGATAPHPTMPLYSAAEIPGVCDRGLEGARR
ncbi:MAG: hypothetical protein ABI854_06770, partial [Betaproteobacteria bacterium]